MHAFTTDSDSDVRDGLVAVVARGQLAHGTRVIGGLN